MSDHGPLSLAEAPKGCRRCPRLVTLRKSLRREHPDWWNAPVPAFGDPQARLAIVGLAPGREGANRTGRPFTGDASGEMLFATLTKFGFVEGVFENDPGDGIALKDVMILNAVKCLPPQNKPIGSEINNCRDFLGNSLRALHQLDVIVALGKIAHDSLVRSYRLRLADHRFAHGAQHGLPGGKLLIDSYHCSRYNVNTGRLTPAMFADIFETARKRVQL